MTSEEILSDNLLESISEKIDLQQRQCELRKYFASQLALALNSNADPKEHKLKEAWDQYCIDLSQDFLDRHISEDAAIGDAYLEIDRLLFKKTGQHINKIEGFYAPIFFDEIGEDDIDIKDTAFKLYNSLSQEQLEVVDTILEAVKEANTDQPNCYYLSGSAGTGKTYIYKTIWHCLIKDNKKAICVAPTGIASKLLPYGITIHKAFKLPWSDNKNDPARFFAPTYYDSKDSKVLKSASVIIIDEISMVKRKQFETIDKILRDLTGKQTVPFGGKVILVSGDFRQLPPVDGAFRLSPNQNSVKSATDSEGNMIWSVFKRLNLTQNRRADRDVQFSDWLEKIGNGTENQVLMPQHIITTSRLHKFILEGQDEEYSQDNESDNDVKAEEENQGDSSSCSSDPNANFFYDKILPGRVILARTNEAVDMWNEKVLQYMPFEEYTYVAYDRDLRGAPIYDAKSYPREPPPLLTLTKYSIIMLLRNLHTETGMCNGSRFQFIEEQDGCLRCLHLSEERKGQEVLIRRINWKISKKDKVFVRNQYPVNLAFAMTIHKAQGQTFDRVGLDLTDPYFNHGQLYTALSRVATFDSLRVYSSSDDLSTKMVPNNVCKPLLDQVPENTPSSSRRKRRRIIEDDDD